MASRSTEDLAFRVNDLTEKFDLLQQSTSLLQLEKEEYAKELSKIRADNNELMQRNIFLETQSTENQQHRAILTRQLTKQSSVLDIENSKNNELHSSLKQSLKTIQHLTKENLLLTEINKNYAAELEESRTLFSNLQNGKKSEAEQYEQKMKEMQEIIDLMQSKLDFYNSTFSQYEDEEKQNEINYPVPSFKAYHPSNKTLDLRSDTGGSFNRLTKMRLHSIQQSQSETANHSVMFNIINDEYSDCGSPRGAHYKNASVSAIKSPSTVFVHNRNDSKASLYSLQSQSPWPNDDESVVSAAPFNVRLLRERHEENLRELVEANEAKLKTQRIRFENDFSEMKAECDEKMERMKEQMGEKDLMIKRLSKQVYELNVSHKAQKKKLSKDAEDEQNKLIALYNERRKKLMELHRTELEREKYKFNVVSVKFEDKMKENQKLQQKNNELQMVVSAPPAQSYCYSLTNLFK